MKAIAPEELKEISLSIMDDVHRFCVQNGIRYSLAFGSLLGAVRHKGFIPWDDDIDIMLPRPDYVRFIKSFKGTYHHLSIAAPELDWNYYASYANVYDNRTLLHEGINNHRGLDLGVKIDIFPIDGVPGPLEEYIQLRQYIWKLNCVLYDKRISILKVRNKFDLFKSKTKYFFNSYSGIQKRIARLSMANPFISSAYVDDIAFNPYLKSLTRVPRSVFDDYSVASFEGREYQIIAGYDTYLTSLYGDYMELPPVDQRVPHHGFTAFWK